MTCPRTLRTDLLAMLGLSDAPADSSKTLADPPEIPLSAGEITLLTGPSGCGKTRALNNLLRSHPDAHELAQIPEHAQEQDAFTFLQSVAVNSHCLQMDRLASSIRACGLADPHFLFTPIKHLSAGETLRVRLAATLPALQASSVLVLDEFAAELDAARARALSRHLARLARSGGFACVIATHRSEVMEELRPRSVLHWSTLEAAPVLETSRPQPLAPLEVEVIPARKSDWTAFARYHHRAKKLGPTAAVFIAKVWGEAVGVVVYAHPGLNCSARKAALPEEYTQRDLSKRARVLNENLRVLQRLVVLPEFRGLGIGSELVKRTLPLLGVRHVESIASDPAALVKSGMQHVCALDQPKRMHTLINWLATLGVAPRDLVDPSALQDFARPLRHAEQARFSTLLRNALHDYVESHHGALRGHVSAQHISLAARALIPTMLARSQSPRHYLLWHHPSQKAQP